MKTILIQLNHPAHFHLFKNTIKSLRDSGNKVFISIKNKEILKDLLADEDYYVLSDMYRKNNTYSIIKGIIKRDILFYKLVKKLKPDILMGTSPEIGHLRKFVTTPAIFLGEDDVNLSKVMYLVALTCYPFFDCIVSPYCVNNGIWKSKTVFYDGFQKLAYLHPNHFTPNRDKVEVEPNSKYYILRFSGLNAYHDSGISGISDQTAKRIIEILSKHGQVLISSERQLIKEFEKYRFKGDLNNMHHYLAFADLFIGDSQTMAAEAGLLGTPFIRYNDFVNRISYLNEIEKKYQLGFGIKTGDEELLIDKILELINNPNLKEIFHKRKQTLLNDKIDVTAFLVWFVENYPESVKVMKENPEYQYTFN